MGVQIHQLSGIASLWHGRILMYFALLSLLGLVAFSLAMTPVNSNSLSLSLNMYLYIIVTFDDLVEYSVDS